MTIISDLNDTIREEELKDVYVLIERSGHVDGVSLKHAFTNEELVLTFDDEVAVKTYAKRHGWTIRNI